MTWTEDTIPSGSQRVTGTTGGVRVPVALTGLPVDGNLSVRVKAG